VRTVLLALLAATGCVVGGGGADQRPDGGGVRDPDGGGTGEARRRVIGYFTSWGTYDRDFQVEDVRGDLVTHINYAFVDVGEDGRCRLGDPYADVERVFPGDGDAHGNFNQLTQLRARHPHLRVLLSIGGYTWSDHFSDLALTGEGRAAFAVSCVDLVASYGFDGLDIDWEYPGGGGEAPGRPEDTANFTALLAAVRSELDARVPGGLLTIAVPAGPSLIAHYDVAALPGLVDWVNVMSYDFHGAWENRTGFNAPLAPAAGDPEPSAASFTVSAAALAWVAGGMPRDQVVVGLPFYGRGWAGVGPTGEGLFQPSSGPAPGTWAPGTFDWFDLAANHVPAMTRHFSPEAQVPWLYDAGSGVMISYDDPESLAAKVAFTREQDLGGVMIWELSGDDGSATLLTAVHASQGAPGASRLSGGRR
jgi:chitinase